MAGYCCPGKEFDSGYITPRLQSNSDNSFFIRDDGFNTQELATQGNFRALLRY